MVPQAPRGVRVLSAVAVTGAGGYLGSRLVTRLGAGSRALVRTPRSFLADADQRTVDLTGSVASIAAALDGAESVVHLAGQNEVVASRDPDGALADTIVASRRLAAAATEVGIRRVVYASTVHVYGARVRPGTTLHEDLAPAPRSPYAIARLASEHVLGALADTGIDVVVLRLTNAVGAPVDVDVDRWTLVTNDLCRQAVRTGTLTLHSSGQQHRDFVATADVEDVLVAGAEGRIPAGTYNVGSGRPVTIRELAELVQDCFEARTGHRPELIAPEPDGPPPEPYHVDVARLQAAGFRPATPLADAVDEIARFCLARKDAFAELSNNTG